MKQFSEILETLREIAQGAIIGTGGASMYAIPDVLMNADKPFSLAIDWDKTEDATNVNKFNSNGRRGKIGSFPVIIAANNAHGAFIHNVSYAVLGEILVNPDAKFKVVLVDDKNGRTDSAGNTMQWKNIVCVSPPILNDEYKMAVVQAFETLFDVPAGKTEEPATA